MQMLEKHFDIAFAAPDGVKKLRELILVLAMQGKLVPQDPSDQPTSELLQEIEAEKKLLVKERKIKTPKPLPPIKPEEVPYKLPQGWEWVRLIETGYWALGSGLPHSIQGDNEQEILLCKVSDMNLPGNEKYIFTANNSVSEEAARQNKLSISEAGTIIFPKIGGAIATNKRRILKKRTVIDNNCLGITPYSAVNLDWGYQLFLSFDFAKYQTGTSVPAISQGTIGEIVIGLPPLPEQRRIVAKIDQLMARCYELEKLRAERDQKRNTVHTAALNRLLMDTESNDFDTSWRFITQHFGELYSVKKNVAELRKAILQLAVMGKLVPQDSKDEPVKNLLSRILVEKKRLKLQSATEKNSSPKLLGYDIPENWMWQCLNDILIFGPTNGFSPKAVEYETSVRSLTLTATTSGRFKGEYSKFISNDIPSDSDLWLRNGDILVQRGNTLEYVGVPAVYRGEPNCFIYPDLMMKLRVSSEVDTSFVHLAMSSEPCRDFLRSRASGTSGTMPKINQATLKSLPIPIPPLAEQHRIVAKIDQLMALCNAMEQQIDNAAGKRTALLNAVMARV